jgi:anti-anti-sigma factor
MGVQQTDSVSTVLACGDCLDISQAAAWQARLRALLDAGAPATLEAEAVQRVDAAALQLLAAFLCAARERGMAITWQAPSAALTRAAQLTGLARVLDLPAA